MLRIRVSLLVLVSCCALPVFSATFVVDSTVDAPDAVPGDGVCETADGVCTLRAATMEANAGPGHDTIEIPAGTYDLTIPTDNLGELDASEGDLELMGDVTVIGDGADATIIDASKLGDRVLTALGDSPSGSDVIEVVGVKLTGGSTGYAGGCAYYRGYGSLILRNSVLTGCTTTSNGGGIFHHSLNRMGRLYLIDSTVSDNVGSPGAGISNHWGSIELVNSAVTGNSARNDDDPWRAKFGGGLYIAGGSFKAVDSVISDNVAERRGGAIYAGQTKIFLERTTISGNVALDTTGGDGVGGAMWLDRVTLDILNSTISRNSAEAYGGGIYSERETRFQILFSTIAENSCLSGGDGAGLMMGNISDPPNLRRQVFKGTIVAGNTAAGVETNCSISFPVQSLGYNVDGDGTCGLDHETDRPSVDPDLAPLAANGGLGHTHGLYAGSIAIDLIPEDHCVFSYDNDRDERIDEDPIDGMDNDGDYRIDEDPIEGVATDQRGSPRPDGPACDAGAFEGEVVVDVEDAIDELIIDVRELIDAGEIRYGRGRSLMAELQVALWFLQFNNGESIAAVRIQLFIIKVKRLIRTGELDPEIGDELLVRARAILELLRS